MKHIRSFIRTSVLVLCACFVSLGCGSVAWGQQAEGKRRVNCSEFHRPDMMRYNLHEHVLNVNNVGELQVKWSCNTGSAVDASPAVLNGVVYVGPADDNVYALNARTGAELWSYTTGGWVDSSPAVANGVVYVGSWDDNLYALNAKTGAKLWSYTTGNVVFSSPAVANGVAYVGSYDDNVYALNAKTIKLWSYTTGSFLESSPVVANGVVYFSAQDYNVYAFGLKKSRQ